MRINVGPRMKCDCMLRKIDSKCSRLLFVVLARECICLPGKYCRHDVKVPKVILRVLLNLRERLEMQTVRMSDW